VHNLACDLKGIERNIQRKAIENLSQASRELGERVEEAVKEKEQY